MSAARATPEDDTRTIRQRPFGPGYGPLRVPQAGFMRNFYEWAVYSRARPFRGVRSSEPAADNLFPLEPTGNSTAPILAAAEAFLASLSFEQRTGCIFGLESEHWRSWCNFHALIFRHGQCLHDLRQAQRDLALGLMRASLSERGFQIARNIMRMNRHLGELAHNFEAYDEWYFWMSIMGVPSATEPWGWQIDGQHLAINCLVLGDQVVVSPTFLGAEPTLAESGEYAGLRLFAEEEELGLRLMRALDAQQREQALLGTELPFDVLAHSFNDNLELPYEGLPVKQMTGAQRDHLVELVRCYTERDRPGHAEVKLRQVLDHMDETWFAWIGDWHDDPFYYRVHSPVILIEFDHQPGVVFANDAPSRRHIHTVVRTPNGNDYGKALIRRYYEQVRRTPLRSTGEDYTPYSIQKIGKPMDVVTD